MNLFICRYGKECVCIILIYEGLKIKIHKWSVKKFRIFQEWKVLLNLKISDAYDDNLDLIEYDRNILSFIMHSLIQKININIFQLISYINF